MARPVVVTKALIANNAALLAGAQIPVSGTALTLLGASLDTARRILLTFGNEGSARTLVLTGTNGSGTAITETLAVPAGGAGTVASSQDFATVTQAMPAGGGWTAAVTLGTNTTGSTPWFVPDAFIEDFNIGFQTVLVSGAATYSIEVTQENVKMPIPIYQSGYSQAMPVPTAYGWPGLSALAGNGNGAVNTPIAGWRLTVTAGTGTVRATALQSGLVNG